MLNIADRRKHDALHRSALSFRAGDAVMARTWVALVSTLLCLSSLPALPAAAADEPWDLMRGIELVSRWPQGLNGMGEDRITAVLYRPKARGQVPAPAILNSSG